MRVRQLQMCGIFGWVLPSENSLDERVLIKLTDQMRHRGPDASGYWVANSEDHKWQLGFGHRRLSIIDLSSAGAQPMRNSSGHALIYNGEIYNFSELRRELSAGGAQFKGTGDTEVLFQLLIQQGRAAIPRLRGMFAFAYWNPHSQELILARDQFGKKPLYIAETNNGGFAFASELKPLLDVPGVDRGIDWDSLSEFLEYRYVPGPNTFFRNIKKLAPGTIQTWKNGQSVPDRFFFPPFSTASKEILSVREAHQRFSFALKNAVITRLQSDAPFGAFLSGGLDSSAVVATMSEALSSRVKTFSVGFEESGFSELGFARVVANKFNTDHHELMVPASAISSNFQEAVQRRGAPISEPADIPILLLSKEASRTVKMVLTGEGSDELLGGYPKHRAEKFVRLYQSVVSTSVHDFLAKRALSFLPNSARRVSVALRAAGERNPSARLSSWFASMSRVDRDTLLLNRTDQRTLNPFPFSSESSFLKRMLFFDQTSWLPDNLLERGDRMMMGGSIEGRMPFMDVELSQLVAKFPDRLLTGKAGGKTILRRTMGGVLPPEIINRSKVGFRVPIDVWFRSSMKDFLIDHLSSRSSTSSQLFKREKVASWIEGHIAGQRDYSRELWTLLTLEVFLREFRPDLK